MLGVREAANLIFNGNAIKEGWGVKVVPLRKKNFFSNPAAIKLEGGVEALMALPLKKKLFLAASLIRI